MTQTLQLDADIIVAGGGLAGLTMTALLAAHGISCLCIDRDDPATAKDARTTAISYGSRHVIAAAGAWDDTALRPCAIRDIHIIDHGSPVLLDFLSRDIGGDMFGWIVQNDDLRAALYQRLQELPLAQHIAPAGISDYSVEDDHACVHLSDGRRLRARLIIGADGKKSFTRTWMNIPVRHWSYNQQAIICTVTHTKPHNHIAVEHFLSAGPFALLPLHDNDKEQARSALVWSEHQSARSKTAWDDETFLAALNALIPETHGQAIHIGPRMAWPLSLTHAYRYIGPRMALVADAAHAIHPIAGQGLNLGLRDIAMLAELLVEAKEKNEDMGSDSLLQIYQRQRRFDNTVMAAATDGLNKLFSRKGAFISMARRAGLRLIQHTPKARRFFMRQAMAAPDAAWLPKLIREGHLR